MAIDNDHQWKGKDWKFRVCTPSEESWHNCMYFFQARNTIVKATTCTRDSLTAHAIWRVEYTYVQSGGYQWGKKYLCKNLRVKERRGLFLKGAYFSWEYGTKETWLIAPGHRHLFTWKDSKVIKLFLQWQYSCSCSSTVVQLKEWVQECTTFSLLTLHV